MADDPAEPPKAELVERLQKALFAALPAHAPEQLVDLLEFIAVSHCGSSFNPDNTGKALEIAAYVKKKPFATSPVGVQSLAKLARHALGSSDGSSFSPEHQLWLLTSSALNTAAAVCEFDGDAVAMFEALRKEPETRGRYMQRMFAQAAMEDHVQNPTAATDDLPPPDVGAALRRQFRTLGPCQIILGAMTVFVAIVAAIVVVSEGATNKVVNLLQE